MIKHILFLVISYVAVLTFMLYSQTFSFGIALFLLLATALFCLAIILKQRKEVEHGSDALNRNELLSGSNKEK